jgi:hypothetical protein
MSGRVVRNVGSKKLAYYGCTAAQWIELRDIGLAHVAAGKSCDTTPLRAYQRQRGAAEHPRNIEWRLTLPEWWAVWRDSGHWDERGDGRGYVMCRKGDIGPYAIGNVFIARAEVNCAAGSKKTGLPVGVRTNPHSKVKPYQTFCTIAGRVRYVGSFPTPEEAHTAYLEAVEFDLSLRSPTPMQRAA